MESKLRHITRLDGIRAVAALMVMIFHYFHQNGADIPQSVNFFARLTVIGQSGVDLFFVLSGFLITRILINAKEKLNYFTVFFWRRSLRIVPLYYFFLIIYYFLYAPYNLDQQGVAQSGYWWMYLQNIAMTFHWGGVGPVHYWSLAVEEHFYLVWPFIVMFCNVRQLGYVIVGVAFIAVGSRLLLSANDLDTFYFTLARADALVFGAALAVFEICRGFSEKCRIPFLVGLGTFGVFLLAFFMIGGRSEFKYLSELYFTIFALFYTSLLGFVLSISDHNIITKLLQMKPLVYIGTISYGLYVYHQMCFKIIYPYIQELDFGVKFVISMAFSFFLSTASYYGFEIWFLKLKNRFFVTGKTRSSNF